MSMFKPPTSSLRIRIFMAMVVLILVSFFLTGAITFYHFRKENEQYHLERLKRKEDAVNAAVDYFLQQQTTVYQPDSLVQLFNEKICELADIHQLDINIYSLSGKLLISSNQEMVDQESIPLQLDSDLMGRIEREDPPIMTSVGGGEFLSSFDYISDSFGNPMALMNLPYFKSDQSHVSELRGFLRTLAEIYFLLFAAAALVAYFVSNYITSSLSEIGKRLNATRLTGKNEPLSWHTNDEIGELVDEYNRMLMALEESAVELARKERDHAWQEMARQVAHEIKNPLTPMRLQLQMLEQREEVKGSEKIKSMTQSMIGQIDTLSQIAEAFARFSSLPKLKKQRFNLFDVVHKSTELFSEQGVSYKTNELDLWVNADKDQWLRVMNNLIKNAIQSVPADRKASVKVEAFKKGRAAIIRICDNGSGIPEHQMEKIFEPQFTTKSGGMGLGLAMVKRIVEQSDGSISIHSNPGMVSCFELGIALSET